MNRAAFRKFHREHRIVLKDGVCKLNGNMIVQRLFTGLVKVQNGPNGQAGLYTAFLVSTQYSSRSARRSACAYAHTVGAVPLPR